MMCAEETLFKVASTEITHNEDENAKMTGGFNQSGLLQKEDGDDDRPLEPSQTGDFPK